jgi:translation initiation factor IF-2
MSDPATSGESAPASPDKASAAPAAASGNTQPFGTFGTTRGSGLARGKRPSPTAAPAAIAAPASYQPSSIEVITSKSEYKNPFTGETSVAVPVINEPVSTVASAQVAAPQAAPPPPDMSPAVAAQEKVSATPAAPELFPLDAPAPVVKSPPVAEPPAAKPELKILPPEENKRPAQSWESGPQTRRDERPGFRPERREPRNFEPRAPREPALEQRAPLPREPRAEQPKPSGGFFAWLKGLFGGQPASARTQGQSGEPRRDRDDEFRHGRRRHRGGRGRQQNFNGPRDGQQPQVNSPEGGQPQGGEYRRDDDGGQRRRRRGGRGRFRGEQGGDPRSDGQQGGGAI